MSQLSEFEQRLSGIAVDCFLSGAISMGYKLGLFKALNEVSSNANPATPEQVAHVANCKPRYVKEWLAFLASADILEVTDEEKFYIKPENVQVLTTKSWGVIHNVTTADAMPVTEELMECFRKDGPYGMEYSAYKGVCDLIGEHSEIMHKEHLISHLLPLISEDLNQRLISGGMMVLDVGCGTGFHIAHLAEHFPDSNFTGIDVTLEAVHSANQRRKDDGKCFDNLAFIQMNAAKLDDDWTDKYDLVLIFDACHDQTRPDLSLKEIYRVLKPGGYFGMLETAGVSNIYENKKKYGPLATMLYGFSYYHCLPVASNSADAICAGTMWGRQMACKMLEEAGFTQIEVKETPEFMINQLYVCKK